MFLGITLFVLFLIIDAVLYAFSEAAKYLTISEDDEQKNSKKLEKLIGDHSRFGDTMDIVVFITNLIAGGYILGILKKLVDHDNSTLVAVATGAVMAVILLAFGVIIPKRLGRRKPNKVAVKLSSIVYVLVGVLYPLTMIITIIGHLVLRLFGIDPKDDASSVTEEEIITMVNEGQEQGVLEASEAEMIANIFEMGDKNAGDIMTHRSNIVAVDVHITLDQLIQNHIDGNFSRFPVYDGDINNIVGTLHIRDALILYRNIPNRKKELGKLKGLLRNPFFTPDTRDIDDLLRQMQEEKVHMGIVVDEYGQTAGLITMEDIIEEIVGNILDEYDEEEEMVEQNEDTYLVDGLTELSELSKLLNSEIVSDDYDTLNGYLISMLDRIPDENEQPELETDDFIFKILEVSGNVIRKVQIIRKTE